MLHVVKHVNSNLKWSSDDNFNVMQKTYARIKIRKDNDPKS